MRPKTGPGSVTLAQQQDALRDYLQALLEEVPEWSGEAPASEPPPTAGPAPVTEQSPPVSSPAQPVTPAARPEAAAQPAVSSGEQQSVPAAEAEGPAWAQGRFQCLVFYVGGLALAAPLAELNGVVPWQDTTPMPNHSPKFLGLLRHQGCNVKVVDLAQVVLPERHQAQALAPAEERVGHIVLIDGGQWGLACERIGEVMTLEPTQVRWRTAQGSRPWLAGTVLEHLVALLDTRSLVGLLAEGAQSAQ